MNVPIYPNFEKGIFVASRARKRVRDPIMQTNTNGIAIS